MHFVVPFSSCCGCNPPQLLTCLDSKMPEKKLKIFKAKCSSQSCCQHCLPAFAAASNNCFRVDVFENKPQHLRQLLSLEATQYKNDLPPLMWRCSTEENSLWFPLQLPQVPTQSHLTTVCFGGQFHSSACKKLVIFGESISL